MVSSPEPPEDRDVAPDAAPHTAPGERAEAAARAIVGTFGGPLLGLAGTHLARCRLPGPPVELHWNYWWQAHYLDAIVDVGRRRLATGSPEGARAWALRGRRLLRTIWLRGGARLTNSFYDDMAWLALAASRLDDLSGDLGLPPDRMTRAAIRVLTDTLRGGHTDDLGGGLFWTTRRDRKNVPASGPAAIHFARTGHWNRAASLLAWIDAVMRDPASGLVLDTLYCDGRRDDTVYTYNQGVVLGALLAYGDAAALDEAATLVRLVDEHLRVSPGAAVLRAHGHGDGGLFTGILVRYLALAALDPRLAPPDREVAATLVRGTADALWDGRARLRPHDPTPVFSPDPATPLGGVAAGDRPLELSTQVQAWTILEAAATLDEPPPPRW